MASRRRYERVEDEHRRERRLAATRLVIESVFSNLKGQMRLEQHLAKTPAGSPPGSPSVSR